MCIFWFPGGFVFLWDSVCTDVSLSASLLVSCASSLTVFLLHFVPFQFVCFNFTFFFGRIF